MRSLSLMCLARNEPFGRESPGGLRAAGLLRSLAATHRVDLLSVVADVSKQETGGSPLARELNDVAFYELSIPVSGMMGKAKRWSRGLMTQVPPDVHANFVPAVSKRLSRTADTYDAVVFLDNAVSVHWKDAANAKRVVIDVHNVAGWSRTYDTTSRGGLIERFDQDLRARLMRRFEGCSLGAADALTVTSEDERSKLAHMYGLAAAVVPSAVDMRPLLYNSRSAGRIGWMGNLTYAPNRDGLLRFLRESWPMLRGRGYSLAIAGPGSDSSLEAIAADEPGVEILGFVEDLDEFLGSLSAAVVPIWAGAGVKLKTVSFMSAGIPIATTPQGAEGVSVSNREDALVAETPAGLADALLSLTTDPAFAARVGRAGRALIERSYTWSAVGPTFVEVVEKAASN